MHESLMNDISCFLDKVEASSKLYSFDADLAEDDFREAIRKRIHEQHDSLLEYLASWTGDTLSEMDGYARREIREDFSWDMAMILDSLIELEGRGDYIPDDVDARMKEWFGEEWQEDFPDILDCGKELNSSVYYWAVGYQMAFAQLTEELEKDSRDSEKTYLQRFFEEEAFFRLKEVFNLSEEDVQKHTQHIADVLYANSEACLDAECMDSLIEDALNL